VVLRSVGVKSVQRQSWGGSGAGAALAKSEGESRPAGLVVKEQGRCLGGEVDAEVWCLVGVSGGIHFVIIPVTVGAWENQRQSCSGDWRSASDGWIRSHTRRQGNSSRGGRGSSMTIGPG
jgi:hypothetical protein